MAIAFVLCPMIGPAIGKGTREDPWRPKYLQELGVAFSSMGNRRTEMLCRVEGTEEQLAALAANPDVQELDAKSAETLKAAIENEKRGETHEDRLAKLAVLRSL